MSCPLGDDLKPAETNELTPEAIKEFRKTVVAVQKDPWNLLVAAEYLTKFCDNNEARKTPEPPELKFVFHYAMPPLGSADFCVPGLVLDGAQGVSVRPVLVAPAGKKASKPSSSAPAPGGPVKKRPASKVSKKPAKCLRSDSGAAPLENAQPEVAAAPSGAPVAAHFPQGGEGGHAVAAEQPGLALQPGGWNPEEPGANGPPQPAEPNPGNEPAEPNPGNQKPLPPPGHRFGCAKCRSLLKGCGLCRGWCETNHKGYFKSAEGWVVSPLPPGH